MSNSARETALINFGREALSILAFDDEWSPDTVAAIATAAEFSGLATTDADGMFAVIPPPV